MNFQRQNYVSYASWKNNARFKESFYTMFLIVLVAKVLKFCRWKSGTSFQGVQIARLDLKNKLLALLSMYQFSGSCSS